ncbi:MAG TPA: PaaI family thioesterase [Edaphobacter sp.]
MALAHSSGVMLVEAPELEALLRSHTFTRRLGLKVVELGDGTCTLRVPFRRAFERPGGIVSGDVYMAAADVAFWLAIKTFAGLHDASVTMQLNTAFLSAAKREPFICRAKVLRRGRRIIYGVAECVAGERILTHHTLSYMRP